MGERRAALAALDGGDGADDDRVRVALEDLLDPAVDRRQRVGEQRRAGGERRPATDGEARRAARAGAAGEAVGEFAVARAEQIDREGAGLAQPLERQCVAAEADEQGRRRQRQRRQRGDSAARARLAAAAGDERHAGGEFAHGLTKDGRLAAGRRRGHSQGFVIV